MISNTEKTHKIVKHIIYTFHEHNTEYNSVYTSFENDSGGREHAYIFIYEENRKK